jgi:hypothetical protein
MARLLACGTFFFPILALGQSAQTPTTPLAQTSNLENLLNQTGTLLVRDFMPIASFKGSYTFRIEAVSLSFPTTQKAPSGGVRLIAGKDSRIGVVDSDEIPGFIAALDYLAKLAKEPAPSGDREVIFTTRGSVELALFSSRGQWVLAVKSSRLSSSQDFFDDVSKAVSLLKDAFSRSSDWLASQGVK